MTSQRTRCQSTCMTLARCATSFPLASSGLARPVAVLQGYKPQFGQPGDEQLLLYGHHWANALHTLNDAALRDAVGDDVSFVFSTPNASPSRAISSLLTVCGMR